MKFIVGWTVRPGKLQEAVDRFLTQGDPIPEGITSLGRWHRTDLTGGYHLVESKDASVMAIHAAKWADLLELETMMVVEDAEAIKAYSNIAGISAQAKAAGGA